jgi:hypothetical protein
MADKPGRLLEILHVPRPEEAPELTRRKPWFIDFSQNLLRRLEEETSGGVAVTVGKNGGLF